MLLKLDTENSLCRQRGCTQVRKLSKGCVTPAKSRQHGRESAECDASRNERDQKYGRELTKKLVIAANHVIAL